MKRLNLLSLIFLVFAITSFTSMVFAQAVPPDLVNYQGILRDSSDSPLSGDYDMKFQFFNVATGGSAILIDDHLAAGTGAVTVTDGLFNAHLGGGAVSDGPAGGTYTALTQVFRDYGTVYLEVQVYNSDTPAWETLSPRIRIVSAAYALNTDHLDGTNSDQFLRSDTGDNFTSGTLSIDSGTTLDVDGTLQMNGSVTKATTDLVTNFNADLLDGLHSSSFSLVGHTHLGSDITSPVPNADTLDGFDSTYFLNTSSTAQTKSGPITLNASGAIAYGIEAQGQTGGGQFVDSNDSGWANVGFGDYGIEAGGNTSGGRFQDDDSSGAAYVGYGDYGIYALGNNTAGYFRDLDSSGYAYVGYGDYGIDARGNTTGGYLRDADNSGYAYVGYGDEGIRAYGNDMGGYFKDADNSGYAYVGYGDIGIQAGGWSHGGYFYDSDSTGSAYVGSGSSGIIASGSLRGGYFSDSVNSGYAEVGYADSGIHAYGNDWGGYFKDLDSSGWAEVGAGDYGIRSFGNTAGGYFEDTLGSGYAYAGYGDIGVEAQGSSAGGFFKDTDNSGRAYIGYGDDGIQAFGTGAGGFFSDTDSSGYASVGAGDIGVSGSGNTAGGHFSDADSSGDAYVGYGDTGIDARGNSMGGYFKDADNSGYAEVGYANYGIRAYGNYDAGYFEANNAGGYGIESLGYSTGGYFRDSDSTGYAYVGFGDYGIEARGSYTGGYFRDTDSGNNCYAGYSTYKTWGSGTNAFVQNHPYENNKVIVYNSPEGDEVATYTRGRARLVNGEARIQLGDTFKWVTNPDIGLTSYITPQGDCLGLYVESLSTTELVVREMSNGTSNVLFDYMVYGLRIGFEEVSIVQDKKEEAYIPSMRDHRDRYVQNPELQHYNALERFTKMHLENGETRSLDLSASITLKNVIEEYSPEVHGVIEPPKREPGVTTPTSTAYDQSKRMKGSVAGIEGKDELSKLGKDSAKSIVETLPMDDEGNIHAKSFRSVSPDLTGNVPVSEQVEVGDVVVVDPMNPGMMRLAEMAADPSVIGIVAGEPGVVLGGGLIEVEEMESEGTEQLEETLVEVSEEDTLIELEEGELTVQVQPETGMYQAQAPVALSGIVFCKVDAAYGSIQIGDLLTTSPTKGHAMRSADYSPGTIIGKALEPLDAGTGLIKVIVMLR